MSDPAKPATTTTTPPPTPPTPPSPTTPSVEPRDASVSDMEDGLRFGHIMAMEARLDVADVSARVLALTEELAGRGLVNLRKLSERMDRLRDEERKREQDRAMVHIAPHTDKYAARELPSIDCAALIPICHGRCCRLSFPLSFQDLDERVVQWDYRRPYHIRQRPQDGYCVHSQPETRGCTVYAQRPTICRTYDCRRDKRIWLDFEQRIPAPEEPQPLVQLKVPSPSDPPR